MTNDELRHRCQELDQASRQLNGKMHNNIKKAEEKKSTIDQIYQHLKDIHELLDHIDIQEIRYRGIR